jgi:hypothetical protein
MVLDGTLCSREESMNDATILEMVQNSNVLAQPKDHSQ